MPQQVPECAGEDAAAGQWPLCSSAMAARAPAAADAAAASLPTACGNTSARDVLWCSRATVLPVLKLGSREFLVVLSNDILLHAACHALCCMQTGVSPAA